ncbi:o-succinylbenzoate--CoA ligase [Oceanobacillus manasiensis]|uniref:o-succinylbenzoate--CoA ligase n=1 Tax=Oceanobacillus manasiensis TaxID=586413 RepID=UPI0005AB8E0C|nr:o-succinylbenzoate--CoA ligase [Oceanobacillus manasiensis]
MSATIPHWLSKQAELAPDQIAVELPDGLSITFSELKNKSQSYAKKLVSLGVEKGSHIGLLSENSIQMIISIHALSYIGAVGVLLNTRLTVDELNYQLNDANVSILLTSATQQHRSDELKVEKAVELTEVEKYGETATSLAEEIQLDDLFTIMYTSGTTGFPKGVLHSYGNHWWSAIGSALNLGVEKQDKWLAALPLFHVSGFSILIRSVVYGMPVFLLKKFHSQTVNEAIRKKGITIVSVVTVMLQQLIVELGEETYPDSFRCMLLGGGPAPEAILLSAKEKQIPVFQSFGMTETASQIVTLSEKDALQKIGSAGKPLSPAQLKINQPDSEGVGEIFVKGPMVTAGYFQNEEATSKAIQHGWLATGDLGYIDNEGFLYVVERRTDLIISGGENIYPSEIESVLASLDGVKEVGVTGRPDPKWGNKPVAFLVVEKNITVETIEHYAKQKLAAYKVPAEFYLLSELPRNASNKLQRNKLLELLN